jgi:pimeloyl-ACP methyl ester carboxylesterase
MSQPQPLYYHSRRLKLHYVVWGDEGKPPLTLIHGGRDHCRNWDDSHSGHHDQLDRFLEVVSGFPASG